MTANIRMRTVIVLPNRVRIHTAPKCASASISAAMHRSGYVHAFPEDEGPEPRLMAVRHPLDRIVSAWAFFCSPDTPEDVTKQPGLIRIGYYKGMPFNDFLDVCLERHNENAHTRKQSIFAGPHEIDWPVRLDQLPDVWEKMREKFGLKAMVHSHKSAHDDWVNYYDEASRKRAEKKFAEDVDLFRAATGEINFKGV